MTEDRRRLQLLQSLRSQGISDKRVLEAIGNVPREVFVESLFAKVPDLKKIFSYTFCREDLIMTDNLIIKDLGELLTDRNIGDIIVIDIDETRIDDEYFSSIVLQHKYDGSINYSQI
jgi:hypothetical protein